MVSSMKLICVLLLLTSFHFSYSQEDFDSCTSSESTSDPIILKSLNGDLQGRCYNVPITYSQSTKNTFNEDIFVWKGVPYAEPPVNEKRYMRPEPIKSWTNSRNATQFSKMCMQPSASIESLSEDCLYLNIFVKSESYRNRNQSSLKPIMFWIHGGGLSVGSASESLYELSTMVAMSDVIGVSINYRLGHLGFTYFQDTAATGNQGFLDQSLAMKWVYDNADKFGGDRTRITIFGESAGAWSVNFHLFYPGSWPYFRNAIMESGGVKGPENIQKILTSEEASKQTNTSLDALNCTGLSPRESLLCAQNVDSITIQNRTGSYNFPSLNIDGYAFNKTIDELALENSFKRANIITGFNSDESGLFIPPYFNSTAFASLDFDDLKRGLKVMLDRFLFYKTEVDDQYVTKIINEYQRDNENFTNYRRSLIQITSDPVFPCPALDLAIDYSIQGSKVFMYEFKYKSPVSFAELDPSVGVAVHFDEVPLIFGVPLSNKLSNETSKSSFSEADRKFSRQLVTYWTNFAKNDDPNKGSSNLPVWNSLSAIDLRKLSAKEKMKSGRYLLMENSGIKMTNDFSSHRCAFWNNTRDYNSGSKNLIMNNYLLATMFICLHILSFI